MKTIFGLMNVSLYFAVYVAYRIKEYINLKNALEGEVMRLKVITRNYSGSNKVD